MRDIYAVLRNYPTDCQTLRIEPLGSAGGLSGAQFWRITAEGVVRKSPDPAQPRTLILRRWPAEHPSPERLQFIHAVLRHAAARGCDFLPLPVTTRDGQSFVQHAGHLWELAPWLPGTADYDRSPRLEKLRAAMRALAQFHNATADFPLDSIFPPAPSRHLTRLRELSPAQLNHLSRSLTDTTLPDLASLARQFLAALPRAVPLAIAQLEPLANIALPLQPCLRDIWHDHVLFTGDQVTGLVDFSAIDIDTPATDIARLLGSLSGSVENIADPSRVGEQATTRRGIDAVYYARPKGPDFIFDRAGRTPSAPDEAQTWSEGLAAYNAVRSLSPDETRAAHALNTSGAILAGCNWIRWVYIEGREFDDHAQVVERFRRIVARCELA